MEITAAMVKELREATGAGMMDCKSALADAEGDMEKAVDVLRTKGLADLAKKADRATDEGLIDGVVSDDGRTGVLVEVNCETDFVARNADFQTFVRTIADHVLTETPADVAELLGQSMADTGKTVEQILGETVGKIGENMGIARFEHYEAGSDDGVVAVYIHGVGGIGVMVELAASGTGANDTLRTVAHDVAMQIAAASPVAVSRDGVPAETVDHEMEIYKAQAAESGKPEPIQEKIAQGRLDKYFREVALVEQSFVKDPDITVEELLARTGKDLGGDVNVSRFARLEIGGRASC